MNYTVVIILFINFLSLFSFAADRKSEQDSVKNVYVSDTDKLLTIHKLSVLPVTDNVNGLYSRSVENKLNTLVKNSHRFELNEVKDADPRPTLEDYENNPELIKQLGNKYNTDAFIGAKILKAPKNISIVVDLFLKRDGNVIIQEQISK